MLGHYFRMAIRNIRRAPFSTGINIITLALGLACFLVAYAVVGYWGYAEGKFPKSDRTYVLTGDLSVRDGSVSTGARPVTGEIVAKYIKTDFPELETVARARYGNEISMTVGDKTLAIPSVYADPEFLNIFDLPFIKGSAADFERPDAVILTETAAMKLFGSTDVVGRSILFSKGVQGTVVGLISKVAQPSHMGESPNSMLRFEVLITWRLYERFMDIFRAASLPPGVTPPPQPENWLGGNSCTTYMLLPRDGSFGPGALRTRLAGFAEKHVPPAQLKIASVEFDAVPVSKMMVANLNAVLFAQTAPGLSVVTLLMVLGGLVLVVAAVNYANVATAQATDRSKEVGLRKTIGAGRGQVVIQYLLEAAILTTAALVFAFIAVEALTPAMKTAMDIDLSLALFDGWGFWAFILGLIAVVTVLAGSYPAFILSRVRPVEALRGGKSRAGSGVVPTLLVGVQFVAASFLLIAVIIMYNQNSEMRRTGLGTDQDPLLVITNVFQFTEINPVMFRERLEQQPLVKGVTGIGSEPWAGASLTIVSNSADDSATERTVFNTPVEYGFFKTMGIKVLAGRVFDRDHSDSPTAPGTFQNIVVGRSFAREFGFASPQDAVGKDIYRASRLARAFGGGSAPPPMHIIGVVEDKPLHLVGMGATSEFYQLNPGGSIYQIVRISKNDVSGGLKAVRAVWDGMGPKSAFNMRFMDAMFDQNYKLFASVSEAFTGLAVFAFVISLIGLFGMSIHVTRRRTREIGVRKTIGASTGRVLRLLLWDFSKPVVVANLIAWPLGFLAAQAYLSVFVHRITLTPVPFLLSFVLTLLIAWVAVGGQVYRAASVKPANVLRYE